MEETFLLLRLVRFIHHILYIKMGNLMFCSKCGGKNIDKVIWTGWESNKCSDCGHENGVDKTLYSVIGVVFIALIIFCIICNIAQSQTPQTLYIAIDSTTNSNMLKQGLECTNWLARINPLVLQSLNPTQTSAFNDFCTRMEETRHRIAELWTVEYVNYQDEDSPKGKYPQYRIGKYRDWEKFNSRTFSETSYPLRTVEFLYEQWYYQDFVDQSLLEYQKEFNVWLKDKNAVYRKWLDKAKIDKINLFENEEYYTQLEKELQDKKLTPKYEPKIPKFQPMIKLPYE